MQLQAAGLRSEREAEASQELICLQFKSRQEFKSTQERGPVGKTKG